MPSSRHFSRPTNPWYFLEEIVHAVWVLQREVHEAVRRVKEESARAISVSPLLPGPVFRTVILRLPPQRPHADRKNVELIVAAVRDEVFRENVKVPACVPFSLCKIYVRILPAWETL